MHPFPFGSRGPCWCGPAAVLSRDDVSVLNVRAGVLLGNCMHAVTLTVLLLSSAVAAASKRMCDEDVLTEGITAMPDLECIRDVKRCIQGGACPLVGISMDRLCQCYRMLRLPLAGRELADYECFPTALAGRTILDEWEECQLFQKREL